VTASTRGVVDTNVVILFGRLHPDDLPLEPVITIVTLAELSVGPLVTADPYEQAIRQQRLQEAEDLFDVLGFDLAAAHAYGRVASSLRTHGRKSSARALDGLIAAIAIANDLPLYTCNPRDFDGIDALRTEGIPHPDAT
jgi:tRNA(fMet)-specific endonuclease VapC